MNLKIEDKVNNLRRKLKRPFISNGSIYSAISFLSGFYGNNIAVERGEFNVTYNELISNSIIMSKSLDELGVNNGNVVAVCMNNYYQVLPIFLAANRLGAIVLLIPDGLSLTKMEECLNELEVDVLFNYGIDRNVSKEIRKKTKVRQVITLQEEDLEIKQVSKNQGCVYSYADILSYSEFLQIADFRVNDFDIKKNMGRNIWDAVMFLDRDNSWKIISFTNKNIIKNAISLDEILKLNKEKSERVGVPFSCPLGFNVSTLSPLLEGRKVELGSWEEKDNLFVKIENIIVDPISNAELDYDTLGVLCQLGSDDDSLKEGKSFKHSNGLVYFKTDTWGKISKEGDLTIIEYDESDNLVIKKENNKGRSRTLKK